MGSSRRQLARHGLRPKKSWGQNFLDDESVLADIIAAAAIEPRDWVVELGAGLGALTQQLVGTGARVIAVERDRDLVIALRQELGEHPNLEILAANAAVLDYGALAARASRPLVVLGNLPYQLSSRLLVSMADAAASIDRAVVMTQREVADRLAAQPGGRDYGLLTVLVTRAFTTERVRQVPPGAFVPSPKVSSTVLRLQRRSDRELDPIVDAQLVATARAAFSSRRKILRNALASGLGVEQRQVHAALLAAQVDPTRRAESLDLAQMRRLAQTLAEHGLLPL